MCRNNCSVMKAPLNKIWTVPNSSTTITRHGLMRRFQEALVVLKLAVYVWMQYELISGNLVVTRSKPLLTTAGG